MYIQISHSVHNDVLNLQRELGVYIVGLFDTSEAAESLIFTRHQPKGLSVILSKYLNLQIDKNLQVADWRIR